MTADGVRRTLVVVLHADVAGYSTLMQSDEDLAHRRVIGCFDRLDELVRRYGGTVAEKRGDALLAKFTQPSAALGAALAFQRENDEQNRAIADGIRPEMRIGINLGEVIEDRGTVWGPGVNLAQRVEQLAPRGGVTVSDTVFNAISKALPVDYEDLGEQRVKESLVRAYAVRLRTGADIPSDAPSPGLDGDDREAPQDRPSIAVLPFDSMSSDPDHGFFGDGLAEDIITTLSKVSALFVIARNSSFAYKGRAMDVRRIAAELGVRYVLEGSVRGSGARIRVTAQLIDSEDGHHLWAERYDRNLEDIFDIQDEITREIVTALRIRLTDGEQAQLMLKDTASMQAWSIAFGALDKVMSGSPAPIGEGRRMLERAIAVDPDFASAHALIGLSHYFEIHFGFTSDAERSSTLLQQANDRALSIDPSLPLAHCNAALQALFLGDIDEAVGCGRRAVRFSPNDAFLKLALGRILIHAGALEEAEVQVRAAMRVNPFHPTYYLGVLANALEMQGRDEEAVELLRAAVSRDRNYFSGHLRLASLLGLAGNLAQARQHAEEALRINSRIDTALLKGYYPTNNPEALARFVGGLAEAGIRLE